MDNNNLNNQGGQQYNQQAQPQGGQSYAYGQNTAPNQTPYGQGQQFDASVQAPYQQNNFQSAENEVVTIGEWLLTLLVACIPCLNIIMVFVWAFGSTKKSKGNYFKALLIWTLIWTVLSVIFVIVLTAVCGVSLAELMEY